MSEQFDVSTPRRIIVDKGYADIVTLQPKTEEKKISATVLNSRVMTEKTFDVDKAFYGCYDFVEFSPKDMTDTVITGIRLYLVERLWSLMLLELIR